MVCWVCFKTNPLHAFGIGVLLEGPSDGARVCVWLFCVGFVEGGVVDAVVLRPVGALEYVSGDDLAHLRGRVLGPWGSVLASRCGGAQVVWATVCPPLGGGHEAVVRAWFAVPTSVRLGLKAWRDVDEGEFELLGGRRVLWFAQEVERGVRQLTRQSHGVLEMLVGGALVEPVGVLGPLVSLLGAGLSKGAPGTLLQVARGCKGRGLDGAAMRAARMAWRLSKERVLDGSAVSLERWAADEGFGDADFEGVMARADGAREESVLSPSPPGYDALSAALVDFRFAFHEAQGWG